MGIFDIFGGDSSTSSAQTTTNNTDKRLVVSDYGIGLSSDSSTVNITTTDQGAMYSSFQFGKKALDTVDVNNAMNGANYESLLRTTSANNELMAEQTKRQLKALSDQADSLQQTAMFQTNSINSIAGSAAAGASANAQALAGINAQAGTNFGSLLSTTSGALGGLFSLADKALTGGYKTVASSLDAISAAQDVANSKGTLDNRTITILGVSAAVAVAAFAMKAKR